MAVLMCRLLVTLVLMMVTTSAFAQNIALAEQKIKAGMLYNFLKYTSWPSADAKEPMAVCLYGGDLFDGHLSAIHGRSVNLRQIQVRTISSAGDAASCHLVVVGDGNGAAVRGAVAGKPIMTVGEGESFIASGGMIAFGHRNNRIAVTLNIDAAKDAGLDVQQRLLNLVTVVHAGTKGGE